MPKKNAVVGLLAVQASIEALHVEYVSNLRTIGTARAAIGEAVKKLGTLVPDRKAMRDLLIKWAVESGAKKLTAASEVSRQMKAAGLELRKTDPKTPKVKAEAAEPAPAKTEAPAPAEPAPVKAPAVTSGEGPKFILASIRKMYPGVSAAELAGLLKQAYLLAMADTL